MTCERRRVVLSEVWIQWNHFNHVQPDLLPTNRTNRFCCRMVTFDSTGITLMLDDDDQSVDTRFYSTEEMFALRFDFHLIIAYFEPQGDHITRSLVIDPRIRALIFQIETLCRNAWDGWARLEQNEFLQRTSHIRDFRQQFELHNRTQITWFHLNVGCCGQSSEHVHTVMHRIIMTLVDQFEREWSLN